MGRVTKGRFVLVAAASALLLVLVANLVADRFVEEPLNWWPSMATAVVVGAFVALIVFRPRGEARKTEFVLNDTVVVQEGPGEWEREGERGEREEE